MPRLRVLAGPSLDELVPIEPNSDIPLNISSDAYEGQVAVYIKEEGAAGQNAYFGHKERKGVTWSIQVQGRFLQPRSVDDILFGNTFDRPLKLPWIFSAAMQFMHYVDPTLEHDLASRSKPWALSPLIATMPHLIHSRTEEMHHLPPFPPAKPIEDDISQLHKANIKDKEIRTKDHAVKRRSHFHSATKRKEVVFGPEDLITTDFCYDFLHFSPDGIALRLPGGISVDVMRYWDGQPVRFVCCERVPKGSSVDGQPWGRTFWCVVIEPVDDVLEVAEKI